MAEKTMDISVAGMSCGHCKMAVENALKTLDGVTSAEVDLAANKVAVNFDEAKTSFDQLKSAIEEAGYEVQ
ncbi:copper chaperone CopZ [Metallumcola ferriviriculae]|uniref:Copper chaperone CopZ n=1 Tax=Metallumcola ferriviriculae TaxID=3039180 RepID=A0AAU0UJK6_9FIRM|nr:copper chaperone CopZ [Desulfitibacteraceae bacterium MK1]